MLVDYQCVAEMKAAQHMRSRATSPRITDYEVAAMITDVQEAMDRLRLRCGGPRCGQ
jgi:hypothetical protein